MATVGGKAAALHRLSAAGFDVPPWFTITGDAVDGLEEALAAIGGPGTLFAVRSSAVEEDSAGQSFAGQFESYLAVPAERVAERIVDVRRSALTDRVRAYRREQGLTGEPTPPAVLVQRMVNPDAAGVAFSADPVTGRRSVAVVSAVPGLGTTLVGGDIDGDTFRIDREGRIIERTIVTKPLAHRPDATADDGLRSETLDNAAATQPAITDEQALAIAALVRAVARRCDGPQDIEWAIQGDRLWLLQARPITTLEHLPDPDGRRTIWDNANIVESYPGITLPLTYSFARHAYEQVYRQFCKLMGVPRRTIDANAGVFRQMIGLIRGRVYYNLLNWYRLLAMLPGFKANRSFMEQMMGVGESLPDALLDESPSPTRMARWADRLALGRTALGMAWRHVRLERDIKRFHQRLDAALAGGDTLSELRLDALAEEYRRLERDLLSRWDAPLINDFFAMIYFGLLGKLTQRYTGETGLHNALLCGAGGMISAEPAHRIRDMAEAIVDEPALIDTLRQADPDDAEAAIAAHPNLHDRYRAYLNRFGERCMEELKLESPTLIDNPAPLLRSIGHAADRLRNQSGERASPPRPDPQVEAEGRLREALRARPVKRGLYRWVLKHARARVTDRENLRFERTRVFGRVRRLFVEMGRRLVAEGQLGDHRDVFYFEVDEALGFIEGASTCDNLRDLVAARKAAYQRHRASPAPPDRFETFGAVNLGDQPPPREVVTSSRQQGTDAGGDEMLLQGTGCCAGQVRGRARVIVAPVGAEIHEGEILVAERTDPGWIMLFPAAAGILVQRGSILSHSAIVARELGVPAIVAVAGLIDSVRTGDGIEMDGRSGLITVTRTQDEADAHAQ